VAAVVLVVAGVLRAGAASLLRTPRADALRDAAAGRTGAYRAAHLLDEREVIVPGVNVAHGMLMVVVSVLSTAAVVDLTTGTMTWVALVALVVLVALVGDLVPRAVGRRRPRRLAYRLSGLLHTAVRMGSWATDMVADEPEVDEEEDAEDDAEESMLISSVLEFSDAIVREVMVPRTDAICVPSGASLDELLELIDEHGFSRVPVVGDGVDDVLGMVIAKDLLALLAGAPRPTAVSEVMRPIDFVPETKRVPELLREMQASKSHMVVVVDEYGGTAGIVTIEDLLEELVGEIVDEHDDEELLVEERSDGGWTVDGRLSVEELSEVVGCELPDEEWDTVAGLVLGLAGRVPVEGERFEVGDVELTVCRVQGRRVATVDVARLEMPVAEDAR
jgi:CBS domain containing-hemolysin-like protein